MKIYHTKYVLITYMYMYCIHMGTYHWLFHFEPLIIYTPGKQDSIPRTIGMDMHLVYLVSAKKLII